MIESSSASSIRDGYSVLWSSLSLSSTLLPSEGIFKGVLQKYGINNLWPGAAMFNTNVVLHLLISCFHTKIERAYYLQLELESISLATRG